jgi:hypothetical protein
VKRKRKDSLNSPFKKPNLSVIAGLTRNPFDVKTQNSAYSKPKNWNLLNIELQKLNGLRHTPQ